MGLSERYLKDNGVPNDGAPLSVLLAAQAERAPDAPAITFPDSVIARAELEAASNRKSRQLAALGVGLDDVVVLGLPNSLLFYECALALWKLGATPLHVSWKLTRHEFAEIVALAKPKLVIAPGAPACAPASSFDSTPPPVVVGKCWKIATSGGSTGRPKLIVDPKGAVWGMEKYGLRRGPDETIINPAPLSHSAPFVQMICGLWEGAHVIEMGRFDPEVYLALTERYRATWAYLVPTMMTRLAALPEAVRAKYDISSIRTLLHMASICPQWVKRAWIDWIGPEAVWEVYGGTERLGSTVIGGADWLKHPGSVGLPRPGIELRIFDEAGEDVPVGEVGEIYFRQPGGPQATFSYIGAAPRQREDWASFGDMGWLDQEGFLYLADRRTDLIISGGVNIYPAEIEGRIDALDGVIDSVVIGAHDDDLGQRVHAFVHLRAGKNWSAQAMKDALADSLETHKIPRDITFVDENVRDEAGKVRRSAWRTRAESAG